MVKDEEVKKLKMMRSRKTIRKTNANVTRKRVINEIKRNASINRSAFKCRAQKKEKRGNNTLHKWPSPTHAGFQNVESENTQDPIFSCTVTS